MHIMLLGGGGGGGGGYSHIKAVWVCAVVKPPFFSFISSESTYFFSSISSKSTHFF